MICDHAVITEKTLIGVIKNSVVKKIGRDQRTFDRSRFDHGRKYRCDVKAQSLGKQNDQSVTTDNHTLIS